MYTMLSVVEGLLNGDIFWENATNSFENRCYSFTCTIYSFDICYVLFSTLMCFTLKSFEKLGVL